MNADGGIEVTASHNPIDYNGMKLVRANSRPVSSDTGLLEIKALAEANNFKEVSGDAVRGVDSSRSSVALASATYLKTETTSNEIQTFIKTHYKESVQSKLLRFISDDQQTTSQTTSQNTEKKIKKL